MKELTGEQILHDMGRGRNLKALSVVLILLILPIAIISIPDAIGYTFAICILALRPIAQKLKQLKCIEKGNYRVVKDWVVNKKQVGNRYLLFFKEYSSRTETEGYRVSKDIYDTVEKKDEFYLIYANDDTCPVTIYSAKDWIVEENSVETVGNNAKTERDSVSNKSNKIEITKQLLLKELEVRKAALLHSIFLVLAIWVILLPLITGTGTMKDRLGFVLIMFVLFGIPIGFFCGLWPILKALKKYRLINNGNYKVVIDKVTDKQIREQNDRRKTLLMFEDYTAKTKHGIWAGYYREYNKVKRGDEFYLVYVGNIVEPVHIYPVNKYYFNERVE